MKQKKTSPHFSSPSCWSKISLVFLLVWARSTVFLCLHFTSPHFTSNKQQKQSPSVHTIFLLFGEGKEIGKKRLPLTLTPNCWGVSEGKFLHANMWEALTCKKTMSFPLARVFRRSHDGEEKAKNEGKCGEAHKKHFLPLCSHERQVEVTDC